MCRETSDNAIEPVTSNHIRIQALVYLSLQELSMNDKGTCLSHRKGTLDSVNLHPQFAQSTNCRCLEGSRLSALPSVPHLQFLVPQPHLYSKLLTSLSQWRPTVAEPFSTSPLAQNLPAVSPSSFTTILFPRRLRTSVLSALARKALASPASLSLIRAPRSTVSSSSS